MPLGNTSLAILLLLASVVAALRTHQGRQRLGELIRTDRFVQLTCLFIGILYVATLFSQHRDLSLFRSTIFMLVILVPLLANHLASPLSLEWFSTKCVKWLTISMLVSSVIVLYRKYMLGVWRPDGLFTGYNNIATLIMLVLTLGWTMLWTPTNQAKKGEQVLSGAAWLLILWTLVVTESRGAWIGLAFGLFLATINNWKKMLVVVGIIGLTLLTVTVVSPGLLNRVSSIFSLEANIDRVYIWQGAWRMFMDHPLLGVGPDAFVRVFEEYRPQAMLDMNRGEPISFAHNLFLGMLSETGILGTLAFLSVLGMAAVLAWRLLRYMRANPQRYNARSQALVRGVCIAIAAVIVREQVDNTIFGMEIGGAFWVLVTWLAYTASTALGGKESVSGGNG
jgi:O-antigen ligase